jgi:hypothetical protein
VILVSGTGTASGATPWAEGGLQAQSAGDLRLPLRRTEGLAADQAPAHRFLLAAIISRLTRSTQSGGRSTGHALSSGASPSLGAVAGEPPLRLHLGQSSARVTIPARRALRSMHRQPVTRWPSFPDREGLEAALVEAPVPTEWRWPPTLGVRQRQPLHEPGRDPH